MPERLESETQDNAGARHALWWVAGIATVVLFLELGTPRLWDRDEGRNAMCAVEMFSRADWVTPVFNDEIRTHKPVLLYWLTMTAYTVFGVNEFAARFWSAALGVGTCICTYLIGRRLFSAEVGLWAGVILATTLMFDVAARAATPDSTLIFCMTLALTIYVYGVDVWREGARLMPRRSVAAAMYAVMGLAILAKGPVGLVLPTAVIGMFLLIQRLPKRTTADTPSSWFARGLAVVRPFAPLHFLKTCWFMRPLLAVSVALLVALPWYVWVGVRTEGDWLRGFFLEHNLGRATASMEGHSGGPWFYPIAILIGFSPWSVFAAPVVMHTWHSIRQRSATKMFLLCWIGVFVGLFTLAKTKLPSYVTPCYPAIALLTGAYLVAWQRRRSSVADFWPHVATTVLAVVGVGLLIAMPLLAAQYLPGEQWLGLVGIVPVVGALICLLFLRWQQRQWFTRSFAVTSMLIVLAVFGIVAVRVSKHQQNHLIVEALPTDRSTPVVSVGCLEPSWVFYSQRPVRELSFPDSSHSADSLQRSRDWHPYPRPPVDRFLDQNPQAMLITTRDHLKRLGSMGDQLEVVAEAPYFLKDQELVLLRRRSGMAAIQDSRQR